MLITTAPRGTKDLVPGESYKWQYVEDNFREVCDEFNYKETRVPSFLNAAWATRQTLWKSRCIRFSIKAEEV